MRALLSVWDKTGVVDLAARLHALGFELISTGGTQRAIEDAGIPVRAVSDVTGSPEMLEGRVKTLHPAIHGGLLARRDRDDQLREIAAHGIAPIDLVVSNLYPFGDVVRVPNVSLDDALEHIDIGGPTLIRAAAKNFPGVIVLVDPDDYPPVLDALGRDGVSGVGDDLRRRLAAKAFAHVSAYDSVIAAYLRPRDEFPERLTIAGEKVGTPRYGENPHQRAAIYHLLTPTGPRGIARWRVVGGAEMSFNNYVDAASAWSTAADYTDPTFVIVKHTIPCGVASDDDLDKAFDAALASDPVSAYGGVVALNRRLEVGIVKRLAGHNFQVLLAPSFEPEALDALRRRRNLRVIEAPMDDAVPDFEARVLDGAMLVQTPDRLPPDPAAWRTVTERTPTPTEMDALAFAWRAVRHVKSNAIVLAVGHATVGVGSGQPNRVDAVRIAIERAGERSRGSVLASDAFFPFADNVEVAAAAGVRAIAQPGGSIRDDDAIAAANDAGIAMVFTGVRHFLH
ncbi:MAG TPA: bifunctional phosphoribosylaminoimidazolecarboxamide formyltransferase/IMP cyclohydrolase [Thermomicrobiaceae bacterium]|nr:bifunctional phosphoribosylaminoimidazolecarboxamide formyltransferase/IMP cyclohydrolase [Thermomicrobiaceae bacterium]